MGQVHIIPCLPNSSKGAHTRSDVFAFRVVLAGMNSHATGLYLYSTRPLPSETVLRYLSTFVYILFYSAEHLSLILLSCALLSVVLDKVEFPSFPSFRPFTFRKHTAIMKTIYPLVALLSAASVAAGPLPRFRLDTRSNDVARNSLQARTDHLVEPAPAPAPSPAAAPAMDKAAADAMEAMHVAAEEKKNAEHKAAADAMGNLIRMV